MIQFSLREFGLDRRGRHGPGWSRSPKLLAKRRFSGEPCRWRLRLDRASYVPFARKRRISAQFT
jgi:hypothetical protein